MGGFSDVTGMLGDVPAQQSQQQTQQAPNNNAQNANPTKTGLRHVLIDMLRNFSYGGGQAALHAAGLPTDQEISIQNAQRQYLAAQTARTAVEKRKPAVCRISYCKTV